MNPTQALSELEVHIRIDVAWAEVELEKRWNDRLNDKQVWDMDKLVCLKPEAQLDVYHRHRLDKHGWLWRVTKIAGGTAGGGDLYEATSLATGFKGTLLASATTPFAGADDALCEQT